MSYSSTVLGPGESVLATFRGHIVPALGVGWLFLAGAGVGVGAGVLGLGIIGFLFSAVMIGLMALRILSWHYDLLVITNKRAIKCWGVFTKTTRDSALDKITDLGLHQSLVGRMLDYGTLRILTANESGIDTFPYLAHPKKAKVLLLQAKSEMENSDAGGRGSDGGEVSAIERLHSQGLLSDDDAKVLLGKLIER